MSDDRKESQANVVDLASFRKKKDVATELTRGGRNPLYVSHLTGKVTGSPHFGKHTEEKGADFGDRLQRIRSSLEKINRLMSDLKKMSSDEGKAPTSSQSKL